MKSPMLPAVTVLTAGVLLLLVGLLCCCLLWYDSRANAGVSGTPQVVKLADLMAKGSGGNRHVVVTDFVWGDDYCFTTKDDRWAWVWLTLRPAADAGRRPGTMPALFVTSSLHNDKEVQSFCQGQTLQGVVARLRPEPGYWVKAKLWEEEPDLDFSTCVILLDGGPVSSRSAPVAAAFAVVGLAGGGALCAFGVHLWRRDSLPPRAQAAPRTKRRRPVSSEDEDEDRDRYRRKID